MLIKNGLVVTIDPGRRIFKDGAVVFEEDRITQVGKTREIEKFYRWEVIDARAWVLIPATVFKIIARVFSHRVTE